MTSKTNMQGEPYPDPYAKTPDELQEILNRMKEANDAIYWNLFRMGFGSDCHAFLEFCGMMNKFQELCATAAKAGIDFTMANIHSGQPVPMETHDVDYLAEKFECIFGSFFRRNPRLARRFAKKALGIDV